MATTPLRILLVEDSASDALLIETRLAQALSCKPERCATLEAALSALKTTEFDVVLLDLSLPDSAGFDGLLSIQNLAPKLPVVILTAYADEEMALGILAQGAQDYLFKDEAGARQIRRAVRFAMHRKQFEARLIERANHDTLTGLANRALFENRLEMALARLRRTGGGAGVFFLDLDGFKAINDTHGHAAGDALLRGVAARIREGLRPYDTAARFGGDEFAVLVEGIRSPRDAARVAQKLVSRLREPLDVAGKSLEVGVSIGVATCLAHEGWDADTLMRHADEAMYAAKAIPHSGYRFYTPASEQQVRARLEMEKALQAAIDGEGLAVHYQPKISMETGATIGVEALLRWQHPQNGLLLSAEFLPLAEEAGLSAALHARAWDMVCADIARWRRFGVPVVPVSINVAASQLDDPAFVPMVEEKLTRNGIAPGTIEVEVPCAALLERTANRTQALKALRGLGVALHLDRFGESAVPLAALKALGVEAVKIPPSLVRGLEHSKDALYVVQSAMDIARHAGARVVATGIETDWQYGFFRDHYCQEGQGFSLCRPLPEAFLAQWLVK